jgi:hypothetical protein
MLSDDKGGENNTIEAGDQADQNQASRIQIMKCHGADMDSRAREGFSSEQNE